jgi:putative salt-induced outer membrane protein YdiY
MRRGIVMGVCAGIAAWAGVFAADAPKRPWTDAADFGFVMTTGNAESTNFAFANKFKYTWSNAELTFDAAALRNESTTRTLSNPSGSVVVTDTTAVTASNYALALLYRQNISERLYWYSGASWYQNFFSGIDDRYIVSGGVGYTFVKDARNLLKGELGLSYTREVPLKPFETNDFLGTRAYLGYELTMSEKSKLTEDLTGFTNFDTSSAWRVNSITAVTASLTSTLALKASYTILYANDPLQKVVPPDAGAPIGTPDAIYTLEHTDTILAVALVVNF